MPQSQGSYMPLPCPLTVAAFLYLAMLSGLHSGRCVTDTARIAAVTSCSIWQGGRQTPCAKVPGTQALSQHSLMQCNCQTAEQCCWDRRMTPCLGLPLLQLHCEPVMLVALAGLPASCCSPAGRPAHPAAAESRQRWLIAVRQLTRPWANAADATVPTCG
jgi:hypothetical protein